MRNPKRIDNFCDELATVWKLYCPDWRFGQIMSNFQRWANNKGIDIFFLEEDRFKALLIEYLRIS